MAVDPARSELERFVEEAPEDPVVMLNLLRFSAGGRATYAEYLARSEPHARAVGAEVLYFGDAVAALVAEPGQAWDAVLLVSYPSRRAFGDMVADPAYLDCARLRDEALEEAVLQPTSAVLPASLRRFRPGPRG